MDTVASDGGRAPVAHPSRLTAITHAPSPARHNLLMRPAYLLTRDTASLPYPSNLLLSQAESLSCCSRRNARPSRRDSSDCANVRSADATRFAGSAKKLSTSASHSSRHSIFVPTMIRWAPTLPPFFRSAGQLALTKAQVSAWVIGFDSNPRNGFQRSWSRTASLRVSFKMV